MDDNLDISHLARITDSYSGADLAAICKEAADIPLGEALRGGEPRKISLDDFETVLQKRKPSIVSWYIEAKASVKKTGEEDVFSELVQK
jgi:transitional endoplasmic reticulum ATPase